MSGPVTTGRTGTRSTLSLKVTFSLNPESDIQSVSCLNPDKPQLKLVQTLRAESRSEMLLYRTSAERLSRLSDALVLPSWPVLNWWHEWFCHAGWGYVLYGTQVAPEPNLFFNGLSRASVARNSGNENHSTETKLLSLLLLLLLCFSLQSVFNNRVGITKDTITKQLLHTACPGFHTIRRSSDNLKASDTL